jgi:hypothetical protein
MYPEVLAAARHFQAKNEIIVPKKLAHRSRISLFLINKMFREDPDAASEVNCTRRRIVPRTEFERRVRDAAKLLEAEGRPVTVPGLAEVMRNIMSDKAIRARLDAYPDLKTEINVVPCRR